VLAGGEAYQLGGRALWPFWANVGLWRLGASPAAWAGPGIGSVSGDVGAVREVTTALTLACPIPKRKGASGSRLLLPGSGEANGSL